MPAQKKKLYFDWVDALKAFAILGILLNHLVEELGSMAWFTNPSGDWPDFATRLQQFFPQGDHLLLNIVYFLGWLGDSGPGVFLLLSGFGLSLSLLQKPESKIKPGTFYTQRLLRIFPLYLAIHLLTLLTAFLIFGPGYTDLNINTLLSLLGLRFTDTLFFYINPSWWFIWLILQLYIVFPFLFRFMKKVGIGWFFLATLGFTILSRWAGIEGVRYSSGLFSWMTGIFFGTRLAEFTLGMVLAVVVLPKSQASAFVPRLSWFVPLSLLVYLAGLLASIIWVGTLVSNLLVTAGLCGLFYSLWQWGINRWLGFLRQPVIWVGVNSFGVFLLHQAPMMWAGSIIDTPKARIIASILVVALSFPMALAIEKFAGKGVAYAKRTTIGPKVLWRAVPAAMVLIGMLAVLELFPFSPYANQFLSILLLGVVLYFIILELKTPIEKYYLEHLVFLTLIFSSLFKLFLFSSWYGFFSVALGGVVAGGIVLFYHLTRRRLLAGVLSFFLWGSVLFAVEGLLRYFKPLETPYRWGEYPALQVHPTRTYSLKTNLNIRLKYNNYNYVLRTNSQGLASPEIAPDQPDLNTLRLLIAGDAFSMPEGVAYEEAYPALLEKMLRDSRPSGAVQVINGGVTGYGPNETLPQLAELVPLYQPDIVIYQFFINEFAEVTLSKEDRLYNIGLMSSLPPIKKEILGSQILAYKGKAQQLLLEWILKKDANFRYAKSLLAFYEKDGELYQNDDATQKVKAALSEMKKICEENNAVFLILFVPGQVEVSAPEHIAYLPRTIDLSDTTLFDMDLPLRKTSEIADSLRIPLLNLTPFLKSHPNQPVYFPRSWHWNPEGHTVVARVIVEELEQSALK